MSSQNPNNNLKWIPKKLNDGWTYSETLKDIQIKTDLLNFLAVKYRHSSLEVWSKRIQNGEIKVNGKTIFSNIDINSGDIIDWIRPPWEEPSIPTNLEVIYDNQDILIINKPSGLPTTPGGGFLKHTLTELLDSKYKKTKDSLIPKPLHRLGRFTSGIMLCARQKKTRENLSRLFYNNFKNESSFRRIYRALAKTNRDLQIGRSIEINTPIKKVPHHFLDGIWSIADISNSISLNSSAINKKLNAISKIKLLERRNNEDLLEITILTGRPHQIRLHLASLGTPLIGDPLFKEYGQISKTATPGQGGYCLHAHQLLHIPIKNRIWSFSASIPERLQRDVY